MAYLFAKSAGDDVSFAPILVKDSRLGLERSAAVVWARRVTKALRVLTALESRGGLLALDLCPACGSSVRGAIRECPHCHRALSVVD